MSASLVPGKGCGCSGGSVPLKEAQLKQQLDKNRVVMAQILPLSGVLSDQHPLNGGVGCPVGNPECKKITHPVWRCLHFRETPCWRHPGWGDPDQTKKHYEYIRWDTWWFCPHCSVYLPLPNPTVQCDRGLPSHCT